MGSFQPHRWFLLSREHRRSSCCLRSTTSSIGKLGKRRSIITEIHCRLIRSLNSQRKQLERTTRIANLPGDYHTPISEKERKILEKPIEEVVQDVHKGLFRPIDILKSYGKAAIRAHAKTNCLTEVMIPEAERWAETDINLKGPLAGIPVSLKDSIAVSGFDVSVGYSCNTGKPYARDGSLVRLLKDAGRALEL